MVSHLQGVSPARCLTCTVSHLYGVAVDGLSSARDVHCFGVLQDVVWHVAGRSAAVTNLPPLLPVIQHLTDEGQGLLQTDYEVNGVDYHHKDK